MSWVRIPSPAFFVDLSIWRRCFGRSCFGSLFVGRCLWVAVSDCSQLAHQSPDPLPQYSDPLPQYSDPLPQSSDPLPPNSCCGSAQPVDRVIGLGPTCRILNADSRQVLVLVRCWRPPKVLAGVCSQRLVLSHPARTGRLESMVHLESAWTGAGIVARRKATVPSCSIEWFADCIDLLLAPKLVDWPNARVEYKHNRPAPKTETSRPSLHSN